MGKNVGQNRPSVNPEDGDCNCDWCVEQILSAGSYPTTSLFLSGCEWVSADVSRMIEHGKLAAARAMLEHGQAIEEFTRAQMPWIGR